MFSPYNNNGVILSEYQGLLDDTAEGIRVLAEKLKPNMTFRDLFSFMGDAAASAVCAMLADQVNGVNPKEAIVLATSKIPWVRELWLGSPIYVAKLSEEPALYAYTANNGKGWFNWWISPSSTDRGGVHPNRVEGGSTSLTEAKRDVAEALKTYVARLSCFL